MNKWLKNSPDETKREHNKTSQVVDDIKITNPRKQCDYSQEDTSLALGVGPELIDAFSHISIKI